jgi:hypothetical protein
MNPRAPVLLLLLSTAAQALPDPQLAPPELVQLRAAASSDPRLRGSSLWEDESAAAKVVHVSPSFQRVRGGPVRLTVASPGCASLQKGYDATYAVPSGDWQKAAMRPFSPFFDLHFGNYVRNATLIDQLGQLLAQDGFEPAHAADHQKYLHAEALYQLAEDELREAENAVEALDSAVESARSLLALADTAEQRADAQAAIADAEGQRALLLPDAQARLQRATAAESAAEGPFVEAEKKCQPHQDRLAALQAQVEAAEDRYAVVQALSLEAFEAQEATLARLEGTVVGHADAPYALFDTEEAAANALLRRSNPRGLTARALKIFNVDAGPGASRFTRALTPSKVDKLTPRRRFDFFHAADPALRKSLGSVVRYSPSQFRDLKGKLLAFREVALAPSESKGTLRIELTRAAYCTGSSDRPEVPFEGVATLGGEPRRMPFLGSKYRPRVGPSFGQAVEMSYDTYVRARRVPVKCHLELADALRFNAGFAKVKGLFSPRPWTPATWAQVRRLGVDCPLPVRPIPRVLGLNAKKLIAAQRHRELLHQQMAQELLAEFLMRFGKSWEVRNEEVPLARNPAALATRQLCRGRPSCAVSRVTFKPAAELFQSAGADALKGLLHRDYAQQTARLLHSSTVIEVMVQL